MPVLCSKIHSPEQLFLYTTLGMVSILGTPNLLEYHSISQHNPLISSP
jgi:hypothetical protein